jgi:hypothetical protein
MERVEGMMRGLKLTEVERRGLRIGGPEVSKGGSGVDQAVGKLLSEKHGNADAMAHTLGPIWCPMRGVDCKDLGDNLFLFTFYQGGGRKKAVEGGPWMFDKELLVLEEFDPGKTLDEYVFSHIPVWVRVYNLPLGEMSLETGMLIGDRVGEYMEMDGLEGGLAMGKCLRIKVKKKLDEPLMRGTMVEVGKEGRNIWCPMEYEYLPDFCYICGIIGHTDKACSTKLKRGEEAQFGKWLRWLPPRRNNSYTGQRNWVEGRGRRGFVLGGSGSSRGSDGPSWRKDNQSTQNGAKSAMGEKEVLSLKANGEECEAEMNAKDGDGARRNFSLVGREAGKSGVEERSTRAEDSGGFHEDGKRLVDKVLGEGEGSLEERQKEGKVEADGVKEDAGAGVLSPRKVEDGKAHKKGKGTFKRVVRSEVFDSVKGFKNEKRKRCTEEKKLDDEDKLKRNKMEIDSVGSGSETKKTGAGLSEQPCMPQ